MAKKESITFADLKWNLPLFDDLFLSMQGQNLMLIDFYLRDLESDLARELFETERTPMPSTMVVSALSQLWIFAAYELLRTWRERVKRLKQDAQKPPVPVSPAEADDDLAGLWLKEQLEQLRKDKGFGRDLDRAFGRVDHVFRRIEALRMNLAKHEVPKARGVPAMAPGYGRIDGLTGSIQWQVDLGNKWVDLVSADSGRW
jgi:hypothetical protein